MKYSLCLIYLLAAVDSILGESTQSFKDAVSPIAQQCMPEVGATDDDFQNVLHRNRLETRTAKCLLACVYEKLGAFASGGHLLDGDHIMPIMEKLYGFKEFQTVMRAQVAHNCVNEEYLTSSSRQSSAHASLQQQAQTFLKLNVGSTGVTK